MSYIFAFLYFLIYIVFAYANDDDEQYAKREHNLIHPYQGNPFWDYIGSTLLTNDHVRLTSNERSQQGAIWNSVPCMSVNWELHVHFRVSGTAKGLFGDGFALWYVKDKMQPGPVFGSKDYFSGLAIIADTYSNHNGAHNHKHPYVSAMVNNGTLHYDHDRDGTHTMLGGCHVDFRNKKSDTFLAIRYDREILTISHDVNGKGEWETCMSMSDVRLPTGYYFGASAATGELFDAHDILSIRVYELLVAGDDKEAGDRSQIIPSSLKSEEVRPHSDDPDTPAKVSSMSGLKLFFLIILGVVACVVCVIVGIIIYQNKASSSKKRFY